MTAHAAPSEHPTDREIVVSRVFDAPRELVWEAWTNPQHVRQWWGPRGFTVEFENRDVQPGAIWEHVLVGPDGTRYPGKSIFREVVAPERVVLTHAGGKVGGPGAHFTATWTFEAVEKSRTRVTLRMVFATAQERDMVVKVFGAIEGGNQTLARLGEHVATVPPLAREFVLTRTFDAPRELVWRVWTEREHLQRWFGPKGVTIPVCSLDLRPGGVFHYGMRTADGHEMWGKWTFLEVIPPERLVVIVSFSDAQGGVTRHPLSQTWPLETLSTTTFTEHEGKTTLTLRWAPHRASEAERRTFDSSHDSMTQGWRGTMEQLESYLAQINPGRPSPARPGKP